VEPTSVVCVHAIHWEKGLAAPGISDEGDCSRGFRASRTLPRGPSQQGLSSAGFQSEDSDQALLIGRF